MKVHHRCGLFRLESLQVQTSCSVIVGYMAAVSLHKTTRVCLLGGGGQVGAHAVRGQAVTGISPQWEWGERIDLKT